MKPSVTLKDWINQTGIKNIADKLGVQPSAVRHWRNHHCLPTTKQMRAIKNLSKGIVTYDSMIEPYFEAKAHQ